MHSLVQTNDSNVKSDLVWIGLEAWFDYSSVRNMTSPYQSFLRNFFSDTYPNCWVFVKRKSPNWVIASPFTLCYLGLLHWSNREVGSVVTNSGLHPAKWKYLSVSVVIRVETRVPTFLFYSLPKSLSIQIEIGQFVHRTNNRGLSKTLLNSLSHSLLTLQNKKERKACSHARMQSVQQRSQPSVGVARAGHMFVSC